MIIKNRNDLLVAICESNKTRKGEQFVVKPRNVYSDERLIDLHELAEEIVDDVEHYLFNALDFKYGNEMPVLTQEDWDYWIEPYEYNPVNCYRCLDSGCNTCLMVGY